jgi:hypothetical protein
MAVTFDFCLYNVDLDIHLLKIVNAHTINQSEVFMGVPPKKYKFCKTEFQKNSVKFFYERRFN